MTHNTSTSITTTTLARVETERLQRGVMGLTSGDYTVTLTRQTATDISAFVTTGDSKPYSVVLTATRSFCGCGDAMFRGNTCKHAVALSLFVIRQPAAETTQDEPHGEDILPPPNLKLAKVRRSN